MDSPTVYVKQGKLLGKFDKDYHGNKFIAFYGIPYAKPPVGPLRFKAPQPPESWGEEIRDARNEGDQSFSRNMITQELMGSEDCLSLNVFTKDLPKVESKLKPVMLWIHGGGFTSGSSSSQFYGPNFLITEDIVLVTINYRLGIFGFLSFDDPELEVSGNAGLKDMVMALKWVQKNIHNFNGDPSNVTIFGESAGGAAVHLLVLSPMAKNLFHKAIAQSGCANSIWACGKKGAKEIIEYFGLTCKKDKDVLKALQNMTKEQLYEAQESIKEVFKANELRPFSPVIENPNVKGDVFLAEHPNKIMSIGNYNHVPLIMGYTSEEGMFFAATKKMLNADGKFTNFENVVPHHLNLELGSTKSKEIAERIKDFYYKGNNDLSSIDIFYKLQSANWFTRDILNCFKHHVATNSYPSYLYKFAAETSLNIFKIMCEIKEKGAAHGDDLGYLFTGMFSPAIKPGSIEEICMKRLVKLWTSFAKTGKPEITEVDWKCAEIDQINYLNFAEKVTCEKNPETEMIKFWNDIFSL